MNSHILSLQYISKEYELWKIPFIWLPVILFILPIKKNKRNRILDPENLGDAES